MFAAIFMFFILYAFIDVAVVTSPLLVDCFMASAKFCSISWERPLMAWMSYVYFQKAILLWMKSKKNPKQIR